VADVLFIDFETRSTIDLRATGVDAYARHETTSVWFMGYAWAEGDVEVATPEQFIHPTGLAVLPAFWGRVLRHVHAGGKVVAHNAAFELAIWNLLLVPRFGWPELRPEQCVDTMAMSYAMALPGGLNDAAAAVGLAAKKDAAGHRLMLQMSKPRRIENDGTVVWWDDRERVDKLRAYCVQDIVVTRELLGRLIEMPAGERAVWCLDQEINNRGVYIDAKACEMALAVVAEEKKRFARDISDVTDGAVTQATEVARLTNWIRAQGVGIGGLVKADVLDTLSLEGLPPKVRKALLTRQEAGKSSTAKIDRMLDGRSPDGRVRHILQYHAAGTGRWGGRRLQPQNLPRPTLGRGDIDAALDFMTGGASVGAVMAYMRMFCDTPMNTLASCLRGLITAAPGNELVAADFSAIEARGVAWIAGQRDVLAVFESGADIYCHEASPIFGREITRKDKDERQIGKVAVLALGYGGGISAFGQMARGYGIELSPVHDLLCGTFTDEEVERAEKTYAGYLKMAAAPMPRAAGVVVDIIKQRWRAKNDRVTRLWRSAETAAVDAVRSPGTTHYAGGPFGRVAYKMAGSFLWCQLPSGRVLCYPYPKLEQVDRWGKEVDVLTYKAIDDRTKQWTRVSTYGGKLVENIVQGLCSCLLRHAMLLATAAGFPIILHVHDEIVAELPAGSGRLKELETICATPPAWAGGFPMAAEGWVGRRYRK